MSARHTPAVTSGRPLDAASARAALRYPSVAAVLAELDPPGRARDAWPQPSYGAPLTPSIWPEPRGVIVVSRSQVLAAAGVPDGIPYDDQRHLAQLAQRDREAKRGRQIAIACLLIAALIWLALIGGPDILLP